MSSRFNINNARKGLHLWDDMIGVVGSSIYQSQLPWNMSSSSNFSQLTGSNTNPGQIQLSTLASSSANVFMSGNSYINLIQNDNFLVYILGIIELPNASTSAQRYTFNFGLVDSNSGTINNGFYINYSDNVNSGSYQFTKVSGGVPSNVSCNVAPNFGGFDRLEITLGRNSAKVFINGVNQVLLNSVNPYPTGPFLPIFQIIKSVGTNARTLIVDTFAIDQNLSTTR